MSLVATFDNRTPCAALHTLMPDGEGGEALLVVLKAAFELGESGPEPVEPPAELRMADVVEGPPELGVCVGESDLVLYKPRVDLIVVDPVAHAPGGKPIPQLFAELHVGFPDGASAGEAAHDAAQAQLIKSVLVSGDRVWVEGGATEPMPFIEMPLDWTRAYGGTVSRERGIVDERNPLGIGYGGARSSDPEVRSELPNIEDPSAPMQTPDSAGRPVGFGMMPRSWLPRRALAGTFDNLWQRTRWPLAPSDQDPAYCQCAPPDQQLARYVGGEPVRLVNLSPGGELDVRLPHLDVPLHLVYADRYVRGELHVDTVELEVSARRVTLTARAAVPVRRKQPALLEIVLGHVKPGWIRARETGRCYVDLRGEDGTDPGRPWYW